VKDAYADAQKRATVGAALNRLFQKTFQAAKHVRTHTAIGQGQVSIATVAVDLAQKIFGDLERTQILVLGAGDVGEKTVTAFKSRGAAHLTVANRTLATAQALAESLDGQAIPFEEVSAQLGRFDIVVCSTAAPTHVLDTAMIGAAIRKRPARPLFLIDLALPRDVEATSAKLSNVFLYNLDDLAKIADENLALRQAEIARCRAILSEKAEALWKQVQGRTAGSNGQSPGQSPAS
jgi:glutamyl-tRNA reductase